MKTWSYLIKTEIYWLSSFLDGRVKTENKWKELDEWLNLEHRYYPMLRSTYLTRQIDALAIYITTS